MGRLLRALLAVLTLVATVGVATPPSFAQSGYTGYGVLTDAAGNGLVGATVELSTGSPLGGTPTYRGVATTQDESTSADPGYFEVQGLPASADYYLTIRLADGRSTVIGPRSIGDAGDEFTDLALASVPLKGTLLDRTTRKPVSRLTAVLGDAQSATSASDGTYVIAKVLTGQHFMRVTDPLGEYEVLDSMIDVGTKSVTWNLRMVALPRSSADSLRGRVTTTAGKPVPGVRLRVFEGADGLTAAAVSRRDGTYSMQVDPGPRTLAVFPPSDKGYALPKPREVEIGTRPRVVDVTLRKAGTISGTIRPATAGRTLSAYATLYDATGAPVLDSAEGTGAYRFDGLPPGTYFVCGRGSVYDVTGGVHRGIDQFWSTRYTLDSATKIVVREGQHVTRTDLVLGTRLVNLSPPAIAGRAKAGSTLTVGRGRWNVGRSDDESPTYAWYRGKKLVATNDDGFYVLTTADVGKSIRVEVTLAHPSYDTSRPVSSAPTATIVR